MDKPGLSVEASLFDRVNINNLQNMEIKYRGYKEMD